MWTNRQMEDSYNKAFQNFANMPIVPICHIKSEPDIDFGYELYFDVYVILIFEKETIR
jgi:hypothetical protein